MEKHPLHIKIPELQQSEEVEKAVEKRERLEGGNIPNDPKDRIEVYLDRLENIFLNPDERLRERNLELLKDKIYNSLIIKPEQVPESYFELQQQVARERGQPVETIPQNVRDQMIETVIDDQKHSLDQWIEYLTKENVAYPTWFRYLVWRNVIKLSQFDKTLGKFKTRTDSTVAPYPDIYRASLAKILDIYEEALKDKSKTNREVQEDFSKKFSKLYAEFISESLAISVESKEQIKGEWVRYNKGNEEEADKLFDSMQAKRTGWCVEGRTTARNYVKQGDFYVYYTYDRDNNPTQPRIAIQMNGSQIGQIRGIQAHQELEPIMADVLEEKLKEFGGEADSYKKKNSDMKKLTEIEKKAKAEQPLSKSDLIFLYEINDSIEGFGYEKDPRIEELRDKRNLKEDLPIIFECSPNQIAYKKEDIKPDTKAYIGEWTPEVFNLLPETCTHIYEEFPNEKVFLRTIETDPSIQSVEDAERALDKNGFKVDSTTREILHETPFSKEKQEYKLVSFSVEQLGFPTGATLKEIYQKAEELGLELCPAEVGPALRLQHKDQPNNEYLVIAMKTIIDSGGHPYVFDVHRYGSELWLDMLWDYPGRRGLPEFRFVFRSRPSSTA